MRVRFHDLALREMIDSASFYEGQESGLGRYFLEHIQHSLDLIKKYPMAGTPVPPGIRRRKVLGFPFTVLYNLDGALIVVVAVAHDRRRPGYWRDRIR